MSNQHVLKIHPAPLADLLSGAKTCEVRFNDRGFEVGDTVRLVEISPETDNWAGAADHVRTISHIQTGYGLPDGVCVLSYAQPAVSEPVAIANRGKGAFWVRWTDAAEGLYGPGIKLYTTPPAAGEPVHQWADQDLWMDGDEADLASARAEGFKTRTLWSAPPAAAPVAAGEPVAYAAFADNGNIQMWCKAGVDMERIFESTGKKPVPLYSAPSISGEPVEQRAATEDAIKVLADAKSRLALATGANARNAGLWKRNVNDAAWRINAAIELLSAPPAAAHGDSFQARVQPWLMECFGEMIAGDREERNHRFLEEALELVQSTGCTASDAHQLVDYVFGRPEGEPTQEVGGVMVTLAALCLANGLDMHDAAEVELARIWTKVEAIRTKQAAKPKHSPLPVAAHGDDDDTRRIDWLACSVALGGTLPAGDYASFREAIDAAMSAQAGERGEV